MSFRRPLLPLLAGLLLSACNTQQPPDSQLCHGDRLGSPAAREEALNGGYLIDPARDCITRASWEQVEAARRQVQQMAARATEQARKERSAALRQTLAQARARFRTAFHVAGAPSPLPIPPAELFVRHDYVSDNQPLAAFVTPAPQDGQRHPAIVWLTGGDTNSLDDFWTPGPAANDQSASAYREAGVVMMFPTLRGGNDNPGQRELVYGEVDDVLAAARALARLPYVDPQQIYLGGHSTGATLALLVAEVENPFRGVFAFGPVANISDYGMRLVPPDLSDTEVRLRSPGRWLHSLQGPTWIIEGENGNYASLQTLCREPRPAPLHCLALPGYTHFNTLDAVNRRIAAQLFLADPERPLALNAEDFTPVALAR